MKIRRHVIVPTTEMFRRYWMLPYHAPGKSVSSSPPLDEGPDEGGGGRV